METLRRGVSLGFVATRFTWGFVLVWLLPVWAFAQTFNQPIEPNAGKWKTWVISAGKDFRIPPPPDARATQDELAWVRNVALTTQNPNLIDSVSFWSAGAPAYRWIELINNRALLGAPL